MGISLLDLVTEHQDDEGQSLRKIVEHSGQDYEVSESSKPVELDDGIFLWERKEDITDEMPKSTYVIIDVMYFSTSVIELFSKGLETLSVHRTHEDVRSQKDVELRIGEGRDRDSMKEGMALINSPSFINENYGGEKTAAMMSNNGANAAINVIEATEDSRIIVGSTTNATAVAEKLQDEEEVHLVSSGSDGVHRAEDHIAAYIISQEIQHKLDDSEHKMLKKMIDLTAELKYDEGLPDRRARDLDILKQINERNVVPEYDRDKDLIVSQR